MTLASIRQADTSKLVGRTIESVERIAMTESIEDYLKIRFTDGTEMHVFMGGIRFTS